MAITGSSWDLPNYIGELYSASPTQTPILSLVGARSTLQTQNDEFPLSVEHALPAAAQNVRSENDAVTAPTAVDVTQSQTKNVIQIMQHAIQVTYKTQSNTNRLTGIADASGVVSVQDQVDFQLARKLEILARDSEYTWINGTHVASSAETVAQSSRGLFEAISDASNGVAAAGADLSKALINQMMREAYADGAFFSDIVLVVNAFQKQQISDIYSYVPTDRFLGGSNIQAIETDFGRALVVLNPFMDTDDFLMMELSVCSNVFQPVPGKGAVFAEDLGIAGAAVRKHVYQQFGPDYGPAWAHNAITGLSTS